MDDLIIQYAMKTSDNLIKNNLQPTITHYYEEINGAKVDISHHCPLRFQIKCDGTEDGINNCHLIKKY